jgi:16S rRNA processing protein RimM
VAGLGEPVAAAAAAVPPDLVELGAVHGAYGVKGWVRITLFGSDGSVLLGAADWWLKNAGMCRRVVPESRRRYGAALLAKWPGCESKEAAEGLKGTAVAVPRSRFPPAPEGSFYWADLIGCRVVNRGGIELGRISGLRENAGGQWLEVGDGGEAGVLLIPLVEQFVESVDPSARVIRVDWEGDW